MAAQVGSVSAASNDASLLSTRASSKGSKAIWLASLNKSFAEPVRSSQ
jgi:hypothetical protein